MKTFSEYWLKFIESNASLKLSDLDRRLAEVAFAWGQESELIRFNEHIKGQIHEAAVANPRPL